jgi:dienelactone hydrolase
MRTDQLAKLGYIAFAIDMYGKGVRAKDAKEAGTLSGTYTSDRLSMRSRAGAGLEVLKNHSLADPKRIAAIGYCFGGTTVLEMARSGAELAGVVSFHGGLATPNPGDAKNIKGKILVLHGADDPFVPPKQVIAFQEEMRNAGVDWQMVSYGGAVHSFTNPDSGNDPSKGAAYNEKADKRSLEAMKDFFAEILK